jgi:hypothetical protein
LMPALSCLQGLPFLAQAAPRQPTRVGV